MSSDIHTARPAPKVPLPAHFPSALALLSVVAAFAAIRFACLFDDLWLDEIWSLTIVSEVSSPAQIFTRLLHDNNHPLNSLWIYLVAPTKAGWIYRLFAWLTGSASIWLAAKVGRAFFQKLHPAAPGGQARAAELMSATLLGGSYLFIHYSSEARGYAPAVCFGLLALFALQRGGDQPRSPWAIIYWLAGILALLSHVVGAQLLVAGAVLSLVRAEAARDWPGRLRDAAWWHVVPTLAGAVYYWSFVRRIRIGGGEHVSLPRVIGELVVYEFGVPSSVALTIAVPLLLGVMLFGMARLWSRDRALAVFFVVVVFGGPCAWWCANRSALIYPRYLIVSGAGALLLIGQLLADVWGRGQAGRLGCLALLALFLWGNSLHTVSLIREGRSRFRAVLRFVADHTPTEGITFTGEAETDTLLVAHLASTITPARPMRFIFAADRKLIVPQWGLVHQFEGSPLPLTEIYDPATQYTYQLERIFPHRGLSENWSWVVYRNQTALTADFRAR